MKWHVVIIIDSSKSSNKWEGKPEKDAYAYADSPKHTIWQSSKVSFTNFISEVNEESRTQTNMQCIKTVFMLRKMASWQYLQGHHCPMGHILEMQSAQVIRIR